MNNENHVEIDAEMNIPEIEELELLHYTPQSCRDLEYLGKFESVVRPLLSTPVCSNFSVTRSNVRCLQSKISEILSTFNLMNNNNLVFEDVTFTTSSERGTAYAKR